MSSPETAQPPPKPEVRQKPTIPLKPLNGTSDTPPTDKDTKDAPSRNSGNVLKIISRFNQPDVQPLSGTAGGAAHSRDSKKKTKRPPTIKPRRSKVSVPPQVTSDQAPPLPLKRRQTLNREGIAAGLTEGEPAVPDVSDGGRSAPDGKEVEVKSGRLNVEQNPSPVPEPQCEKNCSCICHLQRPGMKLVWVSISEKEEEEEEEEKQDEETVKDEEEDEEQKSEEEDGESDGGEPDEGENENDAEAEAEAEAEDGESETCPSESSEDGCSQDKPPRMNKIRFKATLDLIEGQLRRRSDPGPEVVLTSFNSLQQVNSSLNKAHSVSEEESIYEVVIHEMIPYKDISDKPSSTPQIQITKPPRSSKIINDEQSPPAIPPRVPMEPNRVLRALRRSRPVPLPQPPVRSLSPKSTSSEQSPPNSPQLHRMPLLPPPKAKRMSSQSQSLKEDEDDGSTAGDAEKKEDQKPSVTRQKSLDMEAHMPEEFLYQIYTETYISREIRRQTVCRNISKTSADFQGDDWHPRSKSSCSTGTVTGADTGENRSSPIQSSIKQNTLWQDLPSVKESGILQKLTPEECKYQESMFEVMTSEVSYLRSLRVLTEHFLESRELNDTLIVLDKKTLFSNILRIREVSEKFLKDLENRLDESLVVSDICDIISYHAQHNFPAYIDYVRNQIYQDKTYSTLMQTNTQFATVISRLQESPRCQRLPFMSFLLLPFQRITRIKILVENILKRTVEGTDKEESASKALSAVSKIIEECNTQVGKMKQMEELIEINKMLEFDKLKAVPIISQTRFLEKRGELLEVAKGGTLFNLKPKFTPVCLFLFNDLLVLANKKGSERYVVIDHAHRSLVQVQALGENPSLENCFSISLLENHQGRMMERLIKAPSQSDMHRWLAAFPNPEDPNREQEEVIYEDWDCPQVQCIEQYVAKQTDELNLEPPEIINVIRKTNEGWYEGIRLSDGQKGWFPVANVVEITNEHVRRRNLRERYRVMRAASAVTHKTRTLP
ncbi:rho guanine nucleotide exchange factor 15 [Astyanax mexicanus]|uniref:rho guanine nucleotide exchange factor 15 n=1 Tax=Astyanax mexicanus TaxID=7994 RepID=UPI0020CAB779|nr:rho guanine nucleotide exchange factor 15 [Astyanax mexicanus]